MASSIEELHNMLCSTTTRQATSALSTSALQRDDGRHRDTQDLPVNAKQAVFAVSLGSALSEFQLSRQNNEIASDIRQAFSTAFEKAMEDFSQKFKAAFDDAVLAATDKRERIKQKEIEGLIHQLQEDSERTGQSSEQVVASWLKDTIRKGRT